MDVCAVELQIQQGMSLKLPFLHISLLMCVCVRFIFTFVMILRTLYQPPQDSRPQFSNPIFMCSHINNNSLHFSSMLSSPTSHSFCLSPTSAAVHSCSVSGTQWAVLLQLCLLSFTLLSLFLCHFSSQYSKREIVFSSPFTHSDVTGVPPSL